MQKYKECKNSVMLIDSRLYWCKQTRLIIDTRVGEPSIACRFCEPIKMEGIMTRKTTPGLTLTINVNNREIYEKIFKHTAKNYMRDCTHRCLSCNNESCRIAVAQMAGLLPADYDLDHG